MDAATLATIDGAIGRLRDDFLADMNDRLEVIERCLGEGTEGDDLSANTLHVIRREVHSIKGMGGSFGFPTVTVVAHRLEDYLGNTDRLDDRSVHDIGVFLDAMRRIVESGADPGGDATTQIVRGLPYRSRFDPSQVELRDVEVLLVSPSKTIAHKVANELMACGYRVSNASTPWDAFKLAALTKPDMIITSVVFERVSGIDLARAFKTMSATKDIALGIITSFASDHPDLADLPAGVSTISLNASFSDDLADMISRFEAGR